MTEPEFIYEAERAARKSKQGSTLGEVAIARSNLAIADAIVLLAKATDRGAAADEAFAAQSAARWRKPVRQPEPEVKSKDDLGHPGTDVEGRVTDDEAALIDLITKVDEESGYSNIFRSEAILLARAILAEYIHTSEVNRE